MISESVAVSLSAGAGGEWESQMTELPGMQFWVAHLDRTTITNHEYIWGAQYAAVHLDCDRMDLGEEHDKDLDGEQLPRNRRGLRRGRSRCRSIAANGRQPSNGSYISRGSRRAGRHGGRRDMHTSALHDDPGGLLSGKPIVSGRGRGRSRRAWIGGQRSLQGRSGKARAKHGGGSRSNYIDGATNYYDHSRYGAVITIELIANFSTLEPEMLVKRVDSQLKEFQQALGDAEIVRAESFDAVVLILSKLVKLASGPEGLEQSMASKVIAEILSTERCAQFHFHLNQAVRYSAFTVQQAENLCNVFHSMLNRFESLAWHCLPVDELYETVKRLTKAGSIYRALLVKAEEMCVKRDHIRSSHTEIDDERDDSEYRIIPLLPEWKEIKEDKGTPPEVRPNKVDTPYKDWMEYYDIQFRLIREDFIAPLRRGVAAFLQGDKGNRDVKTYSAAKIVSQVTTKLKGICFSLQFDVSGFHRVNWDHTKRLLYGSLLCLIPTGKLSKDSTMLFATIADRGQVREGKILVKLEGDIEEALEHQKNKTKFDIIDSNSYFNGAVSPILQSLQKAEVETMPFTRQLIRGECDANPPPVYLLVEDDDDEDEKETSYNLSCLYGSQRKLKPPLHINILNQESWEAASDTELDSSQLNAIQTALTQEIAVIQGPPGTGKTYIGLKIVEALLENRRIWDPHRSCPILVMCYTNHALDQFLEGIIDTECYGRKLDVIRVGGRCKNEKVEAHNLNKIRKSHETEYSWDIGVIFAQLHSCNPEKQIQKVIRHHKRNTLLPLYIIKHVANQYHYYQLQQLAQYEEHEDKEVEVWLDLWTETFPDTKTSINTKHSKRNLAQEIPNRDEKAQLAKLEVQANPGSVSQKFKAENGKKQFENQEKLIELEGQATLVQDDRMDDDDAEGFQVVQVPTIEESPLVEKNKPPVPKNIDHPRHYRHNVKCYRKSDANDIIRRNLFKERMSDHEIKEVGDIMELSLKDRWRLYNYWENQRYKYLQKMNKESVDEYIEKCEELEELRHLEDEEILESADVIGMTTTGAAKYQHILHRIKPKIVIVEEAAEVLEAHIVSALSAGTQHLILIGDHKQLRPKPNEYVLETKYNLSISLFERLVMKQMSQATLEIQHRMRPEIAQLVCPHVYEKLLNHETVEKYPNIKGIAKNLFFLCHTEPESEHPGLLSYQNQFEADYIVSLCAHLLRLGYSPSQITILTPYVGQLLLLRDKMPKKEFEGVRITAIDNFQGEENDIILFSMVRSTNPNSSRTTIGFVKEDNRVCVSLSRARQGFYAIGNFELIRHQSQLWDSIISDVESRECYGNALPLYCCNHPETKYSALTGSDFKTKAPNGGCNSTCNTRLPCGHSCIEMCHAFHDEKYQCKKICEHTLACGHTHTMPCYKFPHCPTPCLKPTCDGGHVCKRTCHFPNQCGPCSEIVIIQLPDCLHEHNMKCYISKNPQKYDYICKKPCEKKLSCGHTCQRECWESCQIYCRQEVTITLTCGHSTKFECGKRKVNCTQTCSKTLECGHPCTEICGRPCTKPCRTHIEKELPCGHKIEYECFKMKRKEQNGFTCNKRVSCLYPCGHLLKIPCGSSIESYPCQMKCKAKLSCGHRCSGNCSDCYSSRVHPKCVFEMRVNHCCGGSVILPCAGLSDSCDHKTCICPHGKDYSKCQKPCSWNCKHFHCQKECGEECDRPPCNEPCDKELGCGHRCPGLCGERCMSVCIQCNTEKFMKQRVCIQCVLTKQCKLGHRISTNERFFELNCGHIFIVKDLDEYIQSESTNIKPKQCPKCHKGINTGNRYGTAIKKAMANVETVKNLMLQSASASELEREELRHASFWQEHVVDGLVDEQDPLYGIRDSRDFKSVKEKLDGTLPVTNEERCLVQCADSIFTLYISLQSCNVDLTDIYSGLKSLLETLTVSAVQQQYDFNPRPGITPFQVHLSWQLLKDFMSKLYLLALSAQCTIARSQLSSANEASDDSSRLEHAVSVIEHYVQSLDTLNDRITKAQYEEHFHQLISTSPNVHVNTPDMPTVVKGTWKKCPAGHYYCLPPVCGAGATRTDDCCPACK